MFYLADRILYSHSLKRAELTQVQALWYYPALAALFARYAHEAALPCRFGEDIKLISSIRLKIADCMRFNKGVMEKYLLQVIFDKKKETQVTKLLRLFNTETENLSTLLRLQHHN